MSVEAAGKGQQASTMVWWTGLKFLAAAAFCVSANQLHTAASSAAGNEENGMMPTTGHHTASRRLQEQLGTNPVPSYMTKLMDDLKARKKLFEDTPPEEIKYWFEYSGPLQVRVVVSVGVRFLFI
jgi:hypothetical protein